MRVPIRATCISLRPAQGETPHVYFDLPNGQSPIYMNVVPASDVPTKSTWAIPAVASIKRLIDIYVEMYTKSLRYIIPYLSATALFRVKKLARYHL